MRRVGVWLECGWSVVGVWFEGFERFEGVEGLVCVDAVWCRKGCVCVCACVCVCVCGGRGATVGQFFFLQRVLMVKKG